MAETEFHCGVVIGGQAGEVRCIFQNGEVVREELKLKVSSKEGPGELWHRKTEKTRNKSLKTWS